MAFQIWSTSYMPNEPKTKDRTQLDYYKKQGRPLLVDYVSQELKKRVRRNCCFVCCKVSCRYVPCTFKLYTYKMCWNPMLEDFVNDIIAFLYTHKYCGLPLSPRGVVTVCIRGIFFASTSSFQERIVVENDSWVWLVPYWAMWPYETMLLPKIHTQRLQDLNDKQRNGKTIFPANRFIRRANFPSPRRRQQYVF